MFERKEIHEFVNCINLARAGFMCFPISEPSTEKRDRLLILNHTTPQNPSTIFFAYFPLFFNCPVPNDLEECFGVNLPD